MVSVFFTVFVFFSLLMLLLTRCSDSFGANVIRLSSCARDRKTKSNLIYTICLFVRRPCITFARVVTLNFAYFGFVTGDYCLLDTYLSRILVWQPVNWIKNTPHSYTRRKLCTAFQFFDLTSDIKKTTKRERKIIACIAVFIWELSSTYN